MGGVGPACGQGCTGVSMTPGLFPMPQAVASLTPNRPAAGPDDDPE